MLNTNHLATKKLFDKIKLSPKIDLSTEGVKPIPRLHNLIINSVDTPVNSNVAQKILISPISYK